MKKYLLSIVFLTFLSANLLAQVGIGGDDFSVSEALNIESTNKGVLLPKLNIPDPQNSIEPAENPKDYMIAFNNDPEYKNENSFHYTYHKTPDVMAWRGVLDLNIINSRLVPVKTYNFSATGGASQYAGAGGAIGYTIGESPGAHKWVKIPGLESTIEIGSDENQITIIVDGIAQDDNQGVYDRPSSNSYAIGLFIDGKLKVVRTYAINSSRNSPCSYQLFNLKSNIYNLEKGEHTFSVYAITRSRLSGSATTISFGAANSQCGSSNDFLNSNMSKGHMSIQVQESKPKRK